MFTSRLLGIAGWHVLHCEGHAKRRVHKSIQNTQDPRASQTRADAFNTFTSAAWPTVKLSSWQNPYEQLRGPILINYVV